MYRVQGKKCSPEVVCDSDKEYLVRISYSNCSDKIVEDEDGDEMENAEEKDLEDESLKM